MHREHPPPPEPPPDSLAPGTLDVLVEAARRAAVVTLDDTVADRDLEALAVQLEALRRAADAMSARVNGELEARGCTDRDHGHRTKTWLSSTLQVPSQEAGRRVKVARLLRHCSILETALVAGRVGFDHLRVIANATNDRNLHTVIDLQQVLVDLVDDYLVFAAWVAQVTDLLRIIDADGPEPRVEDNQLYTSRQYDGTTRLTATLTGDLGDVVTATLDTFADRLFHQYASDAAVAPADITIPSRSTLYALALEEICRTALAATNTSGGTAADVTYVINADDPDVVWNNDGQRVDSYTAKVACCDAMFHPVVMDRFGVPLDVGREARYANREQRRAARHRDGGCVFPGCDAQVSHTDLHHITHWNNGGTTDMANLACLCRRHHRVIHRNGWHMTTTSHQRFEITTPTGTTLTSQRHGQPDTTAA